ncbi:hypothetical protein MMT35_26975 [Escherichia coli]|nr:hypothetical protein [Escherichia coli]
MHAGGAGGFTHGTGAGGVDPQALTTNPPANRFAGTFSISCINSFIKRRRETLTWANVVRTE